MYRLAAEHDAAVIVCYVAGEMCEVSEIPIDHDLIPRMSEFFEREIELAAKCGLIRGFVDPGLGFYYDNLEDSSVRIQHQMKTFLNAFRLRKLGWPVCNARRTPSRFWEEVRSAEPFSLCLPRWGKQTPPHPRGAKVAAVPKTLGVY